MAHKSYAELQKELEELKAEESRQTLEQEVKALRAKVRPSKIHRIGHGLVVLGKEIVAGAKAFDNGLKELEERLDM
jgi:hypothetical protein